MTSRPPSRSLRAAVSMAKVLPTPGAAPRIIFSRPRPSLRASESSASGDALWLSAPVIRLLLDRPNLGCQAIEREVQFEDIHTRLAQQPQSPAPDLAIDQRSHPLDRPAAEVPVAGERLADQRRADHLAVLLEQAPLRLVREQDAGDAGHRQRIDEAGDDRQGDDKHDGGTDFLEHDGAP